jgi:TIR domain-containing protein
MPIHSWDLFICHAHEDQTEIAWPLKQRLEDLGMRIWLDKHNIRAGDSIRQQIDEGILKSKNGAVIFSPSFFLPKYWSNYELNGLLAKESERLSLVIPIWHLVSKKHILEYSASLADRLALSTDEGLDKVAEKIKQRVQPPPRRGRLRPGEIDGVVDRLVSELQQGTHEGNLLASHTDEDVMYWLRQRLEMSDTDTLLNLMHNERVEGRKRNVATSVLLGKRLKSAPREETEKITTAMLEYYDTKSTREALGHATSDAWLVSRGIALALAGINNGDGCILDWLNKLKADKSLLVKNLQYSEDYKGGPEEAVSKYCDSIARLFEKYPSGRLWEVFYLGHRAEQHDTRVISLLKRCRNETAHPELKRVCDDALRAGPACLNKISAR